MINIDYIINNRKEYEKSILDRNLNPADFKLDQIIILEKERKKIATEISTLRKKRNQLNEEIKKDLSKIKDVKIIAILKEIKSDILKKEEILKNVEQNLKNLTLRLPNIVSPNMPRGKNSKKNVVIKEWGKKTKFDFTPKDHLALGTLHNLIDTKTSAEVSGSRFYYLKNDLVLMQFALFSFVLKKLINKGFIPIIPPVIVKSFALEGTGYLPFESSNIYRLEIGDESYKDKEIEKEPKYLVGTSEVSIVAYHHNTIFDIKELPRKYVGYSPCFRTEVGSWGKDVRGIKRVHQFDKIEMILFTSEETSEKLIFEVLDIEEEILQDLGLPYRILDMCSGDVGMPTYRKFDLEVWVPSSQSYMEVMSNSDLWEFQARRLNIKYKDKDKIKYCHTISATAITNTRPLLAIMENYQKKDGSIEIPKPLQEFMGKTVIA